MFFRYVIGGGAAFAITFGLFLLMQSLIAMAEPELDKNIRGRVIDFVRLHRAEATQLKKRELPQKVSSKSTPKTPQMTMPTTSGGVGGGEAISIAAPEVETNLKLAGTPSLSGASSDADIIPLVRVQPTYPHRAAEKRIEGWVQVEFTISSTGSVKNPRVLDAKPPGIFDRAALRAIKKWKYKPKIENGVAVERYHVKVQLTFELQTNE
jgi:protein TonB